MGSKPLLTSMLPQGSSGFLDKTARWFVGFEKVDVDGKMERRAVRVSFADVAALLAGEYKDAGDVGDPTAADMVSLGNGLNVVGMDRLGRVSSGATADTVYVLGYMEERGVKTSYVMSVRVLGTYIHG